MASTFTQKKKKKEEKQKVYYLYDQRSILALK